MGAFWTRLTSCDQKIQHVVTMRVLGGILLVLGIAEMSLGLYIFSFLKNVHLGGWWGAICVVISGMLGISSKNRSVVIGGCAVSSFGLIAAAVAVVLDGISSSVFQGLVACANTETGVYYGSDSALKEVKSCAKDYLHKPPSGRKPFADSFVEMQDFNRSFVSYYNNHRNYYYNHDYFNSYYYNHFYNHYFYNHNYFYYNNYYSMSGGNYTDDWFFFDDDFLVSNPGHNDNNNWPHHRDDDDYFHVQPVCVCTDHSMCYDYTLSHGSDCGSILTTYTYDLVSSTSLLAACFLVLLIYCIVAFSSACSSVDAKVAAGCPDDIQMTSLATHRDPGSPPSAAQPVNGSGVRYTVPFVVQHTPPSTAGPQRPQPMGHGSPQQQHHHAHHPPQPTTPVVPQYVQLGTTDRPVYILQMYAPTPGQVAPAPVFLDHPQFVQMNSDPQIYLSKESSFSFHQTG